MTNRPDGIVVVGVVLICMRRVIDKRELAFNIETGFYIFTNFI
jgi:hypothetical protein